MDFLEEKEREIRRLLNKVIEDRKAFEALLDGEYNTSGYFTPLPDEIVLVILSYTPIKSTFLLCTRLTYLTLSRENLNRPCVMELVRAYMPRKRQEHFEKHVKNLVKFSITGWNYKCGKSNGMKYTVNSLGKISQGTIVKYPNIINYDDKKKVRVVTYTYKIEVPDTDNEFVLYKFFKWIKKGKSEYPH